MNLRIGPLAAIAAATCLLPCGAARADLVGHYTFNASDARDDSGNGNDGIIEGNAAPAGANTGVDPGGEAFRFGGAGHVEIPIDINPAVLPELSVTMWVRPDSSILDAPGLYKTFGHDDGGWDRCFGLDNRPAGASEFRYAAFTGTGVSGDAPGIVSPVTAEWTFLAAVWEPDEIDPVGLGTVRLHVNDQNVTFEVSITVSQFMAVALGGLRPDNVNESFQGLIDEVQIWDEALPVEDIEEIRMEIPPLEPGAPAASTLGAGNLTTGGTATLRGTVVPNGLATFVFFEYGLTTAYGEMTPERMFAASFNAVDVTADVSGLDADEYHFRVVARNAEGTTLGDDQVFRVPSAGNPLVHFDFDDAEINPTDVTGNGFDGTPEGDAVPGGPASGVNGDSDGYQFFGQGHVVVPLDINPSIYPDMTVTMWVKADEFVPDTPGLHKAFGHDDGGWDRAFGLDNRNGPYRWAAFRGPAGLAGTITSDTTTPVTSEWTFLAAVWDSDSSTVRVHADENNITESLVNTASGFTTASLGSLRPDNFNEGWMGLIDDVRIFGEALSVEDVDAIRVEVLEPDEDVPTVSLQPVTNLSAGSATLNARVIPNGAPTSAFFEYGPTDTYGSMTAAVDVGEDFAATPLQEMLGGLDLESEYHYRVVAENRNGTTLGDDATFRVPDADVRLVYYPFDDGEINPTDESGNDNTGISEGDAFPTSPGFDGDGEAMEFFGFGHVVVPVDINPSNYPDLTVTMWVKANETIVTTPALNKTFGHDDGGWDRTMGLDNRGGPHRWAAFNGNGVTADTGTPVTSEWTFLAAVWETVDDLTATVRVHADGNTIVEPLTNTASGNTTASIGNLSPANFNEGFVGLVDEVQIFGRALSEEEIEAIRSGEVEETVGPLVRGDCDDDGSTNLTDGVFLLNFLFLGGPEPTCSAACDNNGDGSLNITTAVFVFNFLFLGGPPFPEPTVCGTSSRPSDLTIGCDLFTSCP